MPIKTYSFTYGFHEASVTFEVDTEKFTPEIAKSTLEFFSWNYDKEADPVDEVLKKYAIQAIEHSTFNQHNDLGVICDFEDTEGYAPVDGSMGIKLTEVTGYEFHENDLTVEVSNAN